MGEKINNTKSEALTLIAYVLFCICCFYLVEFFVHNPFEEVRKIPQILNIFLFILIGLVLLFLSGSAKIGMRIMLIISFVFGLINYYVLKFRSTPFVPWDIWSIKTAQKVANNYDYRLSRNAIIVSVCFLGMAIATFFFEYKIKKITVRIVAAVICVGSLFALASVVQNDNNSYELELYPFLFTPEYMNKVNGAPITFTMNLKYLKIDKPRGYSAKEAQKLLKKYDNIYSIKKQKNKTLHKAKNTNLQEYPNIIVIMDEAFSDLSILGSFNTNEEMLPNLKKFQNESKNNSKRIQTGYLNVSVCGGNTANTEFEFLTGNTMAFLPSGSIPYQQYLKKDTLALPKYLKDIGYKTYALHPYYKDGWERDRVYPLLGFEKFYSLESFSNPEYVRDYVSDRTMINKIIELYENKEKTDKLFLFNVTMQNHGSYYDEYKNFTPNIKVVGSSNFALHQYLSLTNKTDKDIELLTKYFKNKTEKTIIVFFGDHQPADSVVDTIFYLNGKQTSALSKSDLKKRYKVPYVVWANFDMDTKYNQELSTNFFAANMLRQAHIPTSPYQNFLLETQKKHKVITSIVKPKEDKNILDYKKLQYYNLFDSH
ncbi:LTA synthase family protein [Lachnobacterium bovis]|uniref:LTA synthase family protein n=1 Tax=Lachnobacterium bovis TaxID=140626 RepID=UPI0004921EB5|nr:LTA synthase family protein [Lachnobacterium bovis]